MADQPPSIRSAVTAPRVRTPCRASSTSAAAVSRVVCAARSVGTADQRPTALAGVARAAAAAEVTRIRAGRAALIRDVLVALPSK